MFPAHKPLWPSLLCVLLPFCSLYASCLDSAIYLRFVLIRLCLRHHLIKHTVVWLIKFSGRKQHLVLLCWPLGCPRCARWSPVPPLQPHRGRSAAPSREGAGVARGIPGLQLQGWPAGGGGGGRRGRVGAGRERRRATVVGGLRGNIYTRDRAVVWCVASILLVPI